MLPSTLVTSGVGVLSVAVLDILEERGDVVLVQAGFEAQAVGTHLCAYQRNHLHPTGSLRLVDLLLIAKEGLLLLAAVAGEILCQRAQILRADAGRLLLCRKAGKRLLEDADRKKITIDRKDLVSYLGERKCLPELIDAEDEVGAVNGLAYTELGGTLLKVEVAVLEGTGKIETTGSLGDVMKESAQIAVSYVRSIAAEYGLPTDFYKTKDIHIHFPEGAVPKDGPSAGVTMVTALVSALTGRAVRREVAMTGEISLRGNVLPIGGLKEKTMAAYSAGAKTVLIPAENRKDIPELDPMAREGLKLIPCRRIEEVLERALCPVLTRAAKLESAEEAIPASFVPVSRPNAPQMRFGEQDGK